MRRWKAIICTLLLVAVQACAQRAQVPPESLTPFVRSFYDWYVPLALRDHQGPAASIVLAHRASAFSSELVTALAADSEAQARAPGEIVGLDFDPFLAAQDPCERYEVGGATRRGQSYWVDVYSVCSGKRSEQPDVVAELVARDSSWVFVNFHYPSQPRSDLIATFRLLRQGRTRRVP